jgi:multidrug efflux pump subunit AcrB
MTSFSIRNPYFVIVVCLVLTVIGVTSLARMPVDLFPAINMPEVVVVTFYSGLPPEDVETDITDRLERFFTLASGIDHMESRSLAGVSVIKIYFQPGTDADADVEPCDGGPEALTAGNIASCRAQVRCLQLARLPGDFERRRPKPERAS